MDSHLFLPPVVGFTGRRGSGKDFARSQLNPYGYSSVSLADELKDDVCRFYGITRAELYADKPRWVPVMQKWGYERRQIDENFWIWRWEDRVKKLREAGQIGEKVAVADIRYLNEALYFIQRGAFTVRIKVPEDVRKARLIARDGEAAWNPQLDDDPSERDIDTLPVSLELDGQLPGELIVPALVGAYIEMVDIGRKLRQAATAA